MRISGQVVMEIPMEAGGAVGVQGVPSASLGAGSSTARLVRFAHQSLRSGGQSAGLWAARLMEGRILAADCVVFSADQRV